MMNRIKILVVLGFLCCLFAVLSVSQLAVLPALEHRPLFHVRQQQRQQQQQVLQQTTRIPRAARPFVIIEPRHSAVELHSDNSSPAAAAAALSSSSNSFSNSSLRRKVAHKPEPDDHSHAPPRSITVANVSLPVNCSVTPTTLRKSKKIAQGATKAGQMKRRSPRRIV